MWRLRLNSASLAIVLLTLLTSAASAQLSRQNQAIYAGYYRRAMDLEETIAGIRAEAVDAKQLAVLRAILSATPEVEIHRLRGATENKVYLHPDGHQEAVYGANGELVSDGINDGSYNYFHPTTDPARHFFFDIHTWIVMGNSPDDPTTQKERLSAYISDFEIGILQAAKSQKFSTIDVRELTDGELATYAVFLKALDAANANDLCDTVESQEILNGELRAAKLKKIEMALQKLYENQNPPLGN